ncbi:MAG: hypothetical protein FD143_2919 [Ignavibacteria bacterium]|nr:MAG: hypothetical protein FD143_2919 [Ignavibacteria bacterium]
MCVCLFLFFFLKGGGLFWRGVHKNIFFSWVGGR